MLSLWSVSPVVNALPVVLTSVTDAATVLSQQTDPGPSLEPHSSILHTLRTKQKRGDEHENTQMFGRVLQVLCLRRKNTAAAAASRTPDDQPTRRSLLRPSLRSLCRRLLCFFNLLKFTENGAEVFGGVKCLPPVCLALTGWFWRKREEKLHRLEPLPAAVLPQGRARPA